MRRPGLWIALALVMPAAPAAACSVASTYRVPTNLQLAERADTILLGIVDRALPGEGGGIGHVVVRPVRLLKGTAMPAEVELFGYLADGSARYAASNPRDLINPNPGALTGACRRYAFRQGSQLLLFLGEREGQLLLAGGPFARNAEDVPSPDSLWVKATRLYIGIAALPEGKRRQALIARRNMLRASRSDPDARLLAEDIDRQLKVRRTPSHD